MIELIVNDVSLDLSERTRIGLSVLSSDITQLNTRVGDFTNTFTIPATKRNMKAMEHVNMMTASTNIAYRIVRATFKQDGVEIMSNAYCVINSVTTSRITLNIFSGNTDFIKEIGDLTVAELYEDESGFDWNITNVVNGVDGVVFPIIKWKTNANTYVSNPVADSRDLLPCLKFDDILAKLSDKTGYSIGGSFDRDVVVTPDSFERTPETFGLFSFSNWYWDWDNNSLAIPKGTGTLTLSNILPIYVGVQPEFSATRFVPTENRFGRVKFTGRLYWIWRETENYTTFQSRKNRNLAFTVRIKDDLGNVIRTSSEPLIVTQLRDSSGANIDYLDITIESQLFTFLNGRQYFADVTAIASQHDNIDSELLVSFHAGVPVTSSMESLPSYFPKLEFTSNKALVYGNELKVKNLFKMKVVDVIKEVINSYQVMIKTDSYIKSVEFNYMDTLIQNKSIALDWSDKILSVDDIGFVIPNMAQKNHLRYKHNDTLPNDADSFFTINNENIQEDRNYVQLASEMTRTFEGYNGDVICVIDGLDANREWLNPQWRILEFVKERKDFDVTYSDLSNTVNTRENIFFGVFRNFEFLKDNFFSVIQEISNDAKTVIATVMLSPMDVQNIRGQFVPVWIYSAKHNIDGYFHVNKIENLQNNIAKAELIRL